MKRLIAVAAAAAFLMVFAGTAQAVTIYMTTNQGGDTAAGGTNFVNPDAVELDLIGDTGTLSLAAGAHTLNLWVDSSSGSALTLLGLRITGGGGATIDAWDNSNTLQNLIPAGIGAIVGAFMTVSDIDFTTGCSSFAFAGQPQGICVGNVGNPSAVPNFGAAPLQTGPMLMGTVDITMVGGGTIDVVVGALSSYIAGGGENFFTSQTLASEASTPEPGVMAFLGLGLAGLAFVRRRS